MYSTGIPADLLQEYDHSKILLCSVPDHVHTLKIKIIQK